jgi:quercetin dioxygenase-like cupin family protein
VTEILRLPGGGTTVTVVLAGEDTDGVMSLLEVELQPGSGAGPHRHTKEDETIYVIEGRLRVLDRELQAGEAIRLPKGLAHSFANESDEPVRALFACVPGGLERFFRALLTGDDAAISVAVAEGGLEFG